MNLAIQQALTPTQTAYNTQYHIVDKWWAFLHEVHIWNFFFSGAQPKIALVDAFSHSSCKNRQFVGKQSPFPTTGGEGPRMLGVAVGYNLGWATFCIELQFVPGCNLYWFTFCTGLWSVLMYILCWAVICIKLHFALGCDLYWWTFCAGLQFVLIYILCWAAFCIDLYFVLGYKSVWDAHLCWALNEQWAIICMGLQTYFGLQTCVVKFVWGYNCGLQLWVTNFVWLNLYGVTIVGYKFVWSNLYGVTICGLQICMGLQSVGLQICIGLQFVWV